MKLPMHLDGEQESTTIEKLQTPQQRKVLDAIDELRKCGLDKELSLPQLVVCGDQSAGKSSVLEALTEINFPRADNLCTRFATEIILRRSTTESLDVKIIPDENRSDDECRDIKAFRASISDFNQLTSELAYIIDRAKKVMGIVDTTRNFARDILSIEIQGPSRPQLTVVDLPGIIQNEDHPGDKILVDNLTNHYISQPRTICLAVITAMNDADNQRILTLVKTVDPGGYRSLGIITKPDTLSAGSGNETSFIELADNRNKKYFFKLGWHVLKNRKFEETKVSFDERNHLENIFFENSNFKLISTESLGIEKLRSRLSSILFDHVKRELPEMRKDVDEMLYETERHLKNLGSNRTSPRECRNYLMQMSEQVQNLSKSALSGNYDNEYFNGSDIVFDSSSKSAIKRLRAIIQQTNEDFAREMRTNSHTLKFGEEKDGTNPPVFGETNFGEANALTQITKESDKPIPVSYSLALKWVESMIVRNRGRELPGNYNPLVVSELFWFQSKRWKTIAKRHVNLIARICSNFLYDLLQASSAPDVHVNVWTQFIEEYVKDRESRAHAFLDKIMRLHHDHPINHNHYYTDTVKKIRRQREETRIKAAIEKSTTTLKDRDGTSRSTVDKLKTVNLLAQGTEEDMLRFCCEEALDCMRSIYKVKQKVFIDNVLTLVIEDHIVHGLENIFSPKTVNGMEDGTVEQLASEPEFIKNERLHLADQLSKLRNGQTILKDVSKGTGV